MMERERVYRGGSGPQWGSVEVVAVEGHGEVK